ncbi:MAG: thioesterase family protein [Nostocoides sp.]
MSAVAPSGRDLVPTVADFPVTWPMQTRWLDNDMFGHLNNTVYYAFFDTAINAWLARDASALPMTDAAFAVIAESSCRFVSELSYPQDLVVGLRVDRLGSSSVTLGTALYAAGSARTDPVAAAGHWVHVYIDRETRRPVPIPAAPLTLYKRTQVAPVA